MNIEVNFSLMHLMEIEEQRLLLHVCISGVCCGSFSVDKVTWIIHSGGCLIMLHPLFP
jgi:hypothetical protein